MRKTLLLFILSTPITLFGQSLNTSDFTEEIKQFDYSSVLTTDSIWDRYDHIRRSEPVGYFGSNFQRINTKLISVIKNSLNPLEYFVYGKTRLLGNVAEFQGTITISSSSVYDESDFDNYKQGFVVAKYVFYEDQKNPKTGMFEGTLKSDFVINENDELSYDALIFGGDGYRNNQFEGTWSSYSNSKSYTCNWGDYRIPDSGDLDIGTGEMAIDEKYWDRGWKSWEMSKGYGMNATQAEIDAARKQEKEQWWK